MVSTTLYTAAPLDSRGCRKSSSLIDDDDVGGKRNAVVPPSPRNSRKENSMNHSKDVNFAALQTCNAIPFVNESFGLFANEAITCFPWDGKALNLPRLANRVPSSVINSVVVYHSSARWAQPVSNRFRLKLAFYEWRIATDIAELALNYQLISACWWRNHDHGDQ